MPVHGLVTDSCSLSEEELTIVFNNADLDPKNGFVSKKEMQAYLVGPFFSSSFAMSANGQISLVNKARNTLWCQPHVS